MAVEDGCNTKKADSVQKKKLEKEKRGENVSKRTGRDGFGQKEKRVQDEIKYRSFFGLTYVPNGKFHRKNNETRTHVYDRLDQNGGEKWGDLTGLN